MQQILRFNCLIVILLFSTQLFAQNGIIEGIIKDEKNNPLAYATITIFKASDTSVVNYKLSDPNGKFKITQIPLNTDLRVLVTFLGYESYRHDFKLSKDSISKNFGNLQLVLGGDVLESAIVTAERPPVVMRKDTIEFNAASFKTLPTAMVDELLNKLPGVTMTEDGQFMINGRKVNRILVDGREFFGNDLKATTKNLPSFTVDKVQVHNDERDLFADPNRPLNEVGQVINLKLKKEYKKGLFGKVYAGAGTDDRYEAGGIVNMFRDTTQISVLAYSNNLSKSGVSMQDMMTAGGMDRSGFRSIAITDNGGFELNGISFGGFSGGIETTNGGGVNINHTIKNKLDLNAQYFINHSKVILKSNTLREQYVQNDILTTASDLNRVSNSYNHNIGLRAFWKFDTTSTLEFTPRLNIINGDMYNPEYSNTNKNNIGFLNSSDIDRRSNNYNIAYSHNLNVNKKFNKSSSLNFNNDISYADVNNLFYNKLINAYLGNDTVFQNRKQEQDIINKSINNNISYNKNINKIFDLWVSYNMVFDERKSGIYTYDSPFKDELYNIYIPDLSDDFKRLDFNNTLRTRFGIKLKNIRITPSLVYSNLNYTNQFLKLNTEQKNSYHYLLPALEIRLFEKINIGYRKNVSLPGIDKMQPVVNANNPMNIIVGNPNLKPITSHNLSFNVYGYGNPKVNFNVYINGSFTDNDIVNDKTIDELGNQVTNWVHLSGNKNFYSDASFMRIFTVSTKNKFSIGMGGGYALTDRNSILNSEKINSISSDYRFSPRANMSLGNILEFNLRYNHTIRNNKFKSNAIDNFTYTIKAVNSEVIFRPNKNWVISPKYIMNYRQLTGPGMPKYINQLNASITYQFLENQKAQITLSAFDLLKQNQSITRSIGENFILDSRTTVLTQYFLLTFNYNINNFGAKAAKNVFRFW